MWHWFSFWFYVQQNLNAACNKFPSWRKNEKGNKTTLFRRIKFTFRKKGSSFFALSFYLLTIFVFHKLLNMWWKKKFIPDSPPFSWALLRPSIVTVSLYVGKNTEGEFLCSYFGGWHIGQVKIFLGSAI